MIERNETPNAESDLRSIYLHWPCKIHWSAKKRLIQVIHRWCMHDWLHYNLLHWHCHENKIIYIIYSNSNYCHILNNWKLRITCITLHVYIRTVAIRIGNTGKFELASAIGVYLQHSNFTWILFVTETAHIWWSSALHRVDQWEAWKHRQSRIHVLG